VGGDSGARLALQKALALGDGGVGKPRRRKGSASAN
jgi:hypothetical protein